MPTALPVDELDDKGYQVQASMMAIPKVLQPYVAYSEIQGGVWHSPTI